MKFKYPSNLKNFVQIPFTKVSTITTYTTIQIKVLTFNTKGQDGLNCDTNIPVREKTKLINIVKLTYFILVIDSCKLLNNELLGAT